MNEERKVWCDWSIDSKKDRSVKMRLRLYVAFMVYMEGPRHHNKDSLYSRIGKANRRLDNRRYWMGFTFITVFVLTFRE